MRETKSESKIIAGLKKAKSQEEALTVARRLVREAVDIAKKAGIPPLSVVSPHCSENVDKDEIIDDVDANILNWCGVPVIIDNNTYRLFEMPELNDDPEQKPSFLVTQSTVDLVQPDFERYRPSLERMKEDWQEEKKQFMREKANRKREDQKSAKRSDPQR
jgi:hypothetical protein